MINLSISLRNRIQKVMISALALPFTLASCSAINNVTPESTDTHGQGRLASGVVNMDGFEGKNFGGFWSPELYTPVAGKLVSNLNRNGKQAMRFTWRAADENGTNKMRHAELATKPLPISQTEAWYGFSVYLPKALANDKEPFIFSQWHDYPDPGREHTVPVITLSLEEGNNVLACYRASNKPILAPNQLPTMDKRAMVGKATFDRWVDYVVHVKYDPTGNTGIFQLWQNGNLKVDVHNIPLGYVETRHNPYWKIGMYSWSGKSSFSERTLYYDEVQIGRANATYEAVKPQGILR